MRSLFLTLALAALAVAPASAQTALLVQTDGGLTLEAVDGELTDAQQQAVTDLRATVVSRLPDGAWCLGCPVDLEEAVARRESRLAHHRAAMDVHRGRQSQHEAMVTLHRERLDARRPAALRTSLARTSSPSRPARERVRYEVRALMADAPAPRLLVALAADDALSALSAETGGPRGTMSATFTFDSMDAWATWMGRPATEALLGPLRDSTSFSSAVTLDRQRHGLADVIELIEEIDDEVEMMEDEVEAVDIID